MIAPDQLERLKFPIGTFQPAENTSRTELDDLINTLAATPAKYRAIVKNLSNADLKKTYREGAWNIQQLVNHVADMQMLHFFRMKKALTEPDYKEITLVDIPGWASTHDGLTSPVVDSLDMLESITKRYIHLIQSLNETQQEISYYHPVRKIMLNQKQAIAMTAWHVKHHLEHIKIALAN
jgi:uncharacterized damage-inducible protein DinB